MNYYDIKQEILLTVDISKGKAKVLANSFIEKGWKYKMYRPTYYDLVMFLQKELGNEYFKLVRPVLYEPAKETNPKDEVVVKCKYADMSDEAFNKLGVPNE
jgi:hypothetical protein